MQEEDKLLIRALNISYYFLKARPRTVEEVRKRLLLSAKQKPTRYPFDDSIIKRAIDRLTEEGLLDDKKFVEWFVRYRSIMKPKGTYVLKQELKKLGVRDELIDAHFEKNPVDEEKVAKKLIEKRMSRYASAPPLERKRKLTDFLLRRGFSYEVVKRVVS